MTRLIFSFVIGAFVTGLTFSGLTAEPLALTNAVASEDQVAREKRRLARTGERLLKPGSRKGTIMVVNTQKRVSTAELDVVAANLRRKMELNAITVDGTKVDVLSALAAKTALGSEVVVFVVDDSALPVSLVAREERWGIVNVAKLDDGKIDRVIRFGRAKAQVMRTLACVCGAGDSQFPSSLMSIGDRPQDLDAVDSELPVDVMNKMATSLAKIGVTPAITASYRRACQEGWAPKPTNDVQQAIWDKVHKAPTAPIVIKPETKKVR